jgi:hypothetical protein
MRRELENALDLARLLPPGELPAFLGTIEEIRVTALARIGAPAAQSRPDESLTIEQAHKRLGVSKSWLYHNWKKFEHKFARQEGTKVLFSSNGIDAYLRGKSK